MEYRKGKKETLGKLYIQAGLEEALALPSDLRPHYLSLVLRLPTEISQKITRKAIDWTNNWGHHSYYVQRHDTLHITLIDIGRTCSFQSSLQEIIEKLNQFLGDTKPPSISVKISEAKIGSSGINCELIAEGKLDDWISELGEAISVGNVKKLAARSISLVRYRTQDDNEWDIIRNSLANLESVEASFNDPVSFRELSLVRLDKVAQYFDVLHTFQI